MKDADVCLGSDRASIHYTMPLLQHFVAIQTLSINKIKILYYYFLVHQYL
jgi:hypothetical protein